ncbi:MAG: HAD-IA family hydrolase [Candidatus Marinimicrobia bacterium]|nr:HAD-IA family hydrolase [Candidatus Neomarinimicrobiota bacterium]
MPTLPTSPREELAQLPWDRLEAILFDMDGVLCDSEPLILEAAQAMFMERFGMRPAAADFAPFIGRGENRYLGGVAEQHGLRLELPADKDRTYALYLELIRGRLRPLPGVLDFVAACRTRGLRLAVATGADRIKLEGNLREIGLPPASFAACLTAEDLTHPKPHPEIFLRAAAALQTPPGRCLVIEDSVNGLRAARAAGCLALGITGSFTPEALRDAGAQWVADRLAAPEATRCAR